MMEPPYLHTSDPEETAVDQEQVEPQAPLWKMVRGHHTLWIAEVPFIPAMKSDNKDFGYVAQQRLEVTLKRQKRLLADLSRYQDYQTTFELRLVAWPQEHGIAHIGLAILGKVFHPDRQVSRQHALKLWQHFEALFPSEPPFSYPLIPVQLEPNEQGQQRYSFEQWYQPVPFDQLTGTSLVELRKYEDWPIPLLTGQVRYTYDYLPHSFEPALDYSALSRLLATMVEQHNRAVVSITIRPQRLNTLEIPMLYAILGWNQQLLAGNRTYGNQVIPSPSQILTEELELPFDVSALHFKQRAALGCEIYENLLQQRQTLFLTRLQVTGIPQAEQTLVEALGSEIVANVNHPIPSLWSPVSPTNVDELHWARFNTQWLEFVRWGMTHNIPALARLRQFATIDEVFGAFRLPIAPGNGLPGLVVRDEPFALPAAYVPSHPNGLLVGTIQDRGMPTTVPCYLPKQGPVCLFGECKEAQSLILQDILNGIQPLPCICLSTQTPSPLEGKYQIQHLTLDLALRSSVPVSPLLIPSTNSPACLFNLWTSVLATLLHCDATTAALLHLASIQASEQYTSGWTLATFVQHLHDFLQQYNQPALSSIGSTLMSLAEQLCPLISQALDHISSSLSNETSLLIQMIGATGTLLETLLAGLLWSWCTLAFAPYHDQSQQTPRGFTVLDNAHIVLGHTSSMLSRQISELLRHGCTCLFIDERPDLLNEQLISNASAILVTACQSTQVSRHITNLLGLSQADMLRMQRLRNNEAIISMPQQNTLLIDISNEATKAR